MPAYRGLGKALDNQIQGYYSRVRLSTSETVTPLTEYPPMPAYRGLVTRCSVNQITDSLTVRLPQFHRYPLQAVCGLVQRAKGRASPQAVNGNGVRVKHAERHSRQSEMVIASEVDSHKIME